MYNQKRRICAVIPCVIPDCLNSEHMSEAGVLHIYHCYAYKYH